jgi:hypothetical protein
LLLLLFVVSAIKDKTSLKSLLVLLAIAFDALFALTANKYCYVLAVIMCFLNLLLPVRHYFLPKVPNGVGYIKLTLPPRYNIAEACIFYPTKNDPKQPVEAKKTVDWFIPNFVEKMAGSDKGPFKVPLPIFQFVMRYMKRYKLVFSASNEISDEMNEAIIFSHGLTANIHAYTSLLTRLVAGHRMVISMQHTEQYSFSGVPIEDRRIEIVKRAQDIINTYDFITNEEEMRNIFGEAWKKPKQINLMGHSYGGGSIIQASSMMRDRQIKSIVALDPWLAAVNTSLLESNIPHPIISIENDYFTRDKSIALLNDKLS